jgi:hypothetical protein
MTSALHEVCCASFPPDRLAELAEIRCAPGVRVAFAADRAWVHWEAGDERILRQVLPIAGVQLYLFRDGRWFRAGQHLPAFEVPQQLDYRPLHERLMPAPVQPVPGLPPNLRPVLLRLVQDDQPRVTTAMACDLAELASWADTVPVARLAALQAACCESRVLLLGERLPLVASAERFWGERLLVPLGYRPEPALPETALHAAVGLADDEILVMRADNAEIIARSTFQPLTRAGLRLASREGAR